MTTLKFENLEDVRALRREKKKRPRMPKHGQALKKSSLRAVHHITKIQKQKKR